MTEDSDKLSIPYIRGEFNITNQQIGDAICKTKSAINERSRKKRSLSIDEGKKLSKYLDKELRIRGVELNNYTESLEALKEHLNYLFNK